MKVCIFAVHIFKMKSSLYLFIFLVTFVLYSCKEDKERLVLQQKEAQKKEIIFKNIKSAWRFHSPNLLPKASSIINNWTQWKDFEKELQTVPQKTLEAYQKKSILFSQKASLLPNSIPSFYNVPQIKSRLIILQNKCQTLELFITLNIIPQERVLQTINEINTEIISLEKQWNELIIKSEIPKEEGESDLIKMKDTSRALPTIKPLK